MGKSYRLAGGLFLLVFFALAVLPRPARPSRPAEPAAHEEALKPLSGRVICVDPGHGGADGGARARYSKKWEKAINLSVAKKIGDALEKAGARVIQTREDDGALSSEKRADLSARMKLAKDGGAQMLLSIHMNEYRSRRESGPQVFYRSGQEQSRLLAGALQAALIETLSPPKKRVAMAGDYFILSLSIPSVLIECGFISNQTEEALLLTDDYQARLAQAVTRGVVEYFSLPK